MTKDEVLKLALEALEDWNLPLNPQPDEEIITAIKEALMSGTDGAQPEQEQCCYGGIAHDCHAGDGCRIAERIKAALWDKQK